MGGGYVQTHLYKQGKCCMKIRTITGSNRCNAWDSNQCGRMEAVCPDWAIYWTMGHFLKPLAAINLPKSPTFLGNFCKDVKIIHFSLEIIFGQLL